MVTNEYRLLVFGICTKSQIKTTESSKRKDHQIVSGEVLELLVDRGELKFSLFTGDSRLGSRLKLGGGINSRSSSSGVFGVWPLFGEEMVGTAKVGFPVSTNLNGNELYVYD